MVKYIALSWVVILFNFSHFVHAEEKSDIRIVFEKGKKYRYEFEESEREYSIKYYSTLTVKDVVDGISKMSMTFDRIVFKYRKFKVNYDSKLHKGKLNIHALKYHVMVGRPIQVKIREDGEIAELTGFKEIGDIYVQEMKKRNPILASLDVFMKAKKSEFENFRLVQRMYFWLTTTPVEPVEPSAEWSKKVAFWVLSWRSAYFLFKYTVKSISLSTTKIGVSGEVLQGNSKNEILSGKITGTCDIDMKKRCVKKKDISISYVCKNIPTKKVNKTRIRFKSTLKAIE